MNRPNPEDFGLTASGALTSFCKAHSEYLAYGDVERKVQEVTDADMLEFYIQQKCYWCEVTEQLRFVLRGRPVAVVGYSNYRDAIKFAIKLK